MKKLNWRTEMRKINDLVLFEENPRTITEHQMEILKRSLKKFNLVELPAIDSDGTILAGNQRIRALQLLGRGEEEIPIRTPNRKLSKKEAEEYLLTSNRSGGTWNYEILKSFDMDLLIDVGFEESDLSVFDDLLETEDDQFDVEKEIEEAKKTNIKTGDIFALGQHRLTCNDSTNPNVVKELLGKKRVDLINTDIPYNIGLSYNSGIGGKKNYGGTINDKKTDREYKEFVKKIIQNGLSVTKKDCHIFFWSDEKYIGMIQELYKEVGIDYKRLCMWLKDNQNPTPQIAFNKVVELCSYGVIGKPYLSDKIKNLNEVLNKEVATGNRLIDDILDLLNIWMVKRLPGNEMEHPTQKPPTLYEKSLRRCTKPGDLVLDLTAGSGTVMVACEQLKRTAYLVEIEPVFCQLIINRYEKISNNKAKKLN